MILKTTTNEFCFINVSFYETIADPRHFFIMRDAKVGKRKRLDH